MVTTQAASTSEIRSHFPALERVHNGHPVAYFDGPGGTQVPRDVVDAMADYLYHHNANTHWNYPTSAETDDLLSRARQTFADFLNAAANEVAFGPNMTTLTYHVSRALGLTWWPGDEVVTTELDHHANVDPWLRLLKERGVTVHKVRMLPDSGQLDWDDLARKLNRNTKLLAIGAASNALGTVTDVANAGALAHEVGALVYVDAVHYAAHQLVDVKALDCDFLVCSPYKFYGPHLGVLYGRQALLETLDVPKLAPSPDNAPDRMETGTQSHEAIAGAAAAVEFLASLAPSGSPRKRLEAATKALHERNQSLIETLWAGLCALNGVRLVGPPPDVARTPTLSFVVRDLPSAQVCEHLAQRGVFASDGDFYAMTVVQRLGLTDQGLVRVGCSCYTCEEEIERLLSAVGELA